MCPTARDFFARQGDLTQQYFVYCKENQRRMAEKDPLFGPVDIFQQGPIFHGPLLLFLRLYSTIHLQGRRCVRSHSGSGGANCFMREERYKHGEILQTQRKRHFVGTEVVAGFTTFFAMAYIIVVNPVSSVSRGWNGARCSWPPSSPRSSAPWSWAWWPTSPTPRPPAWA